MGGVQQAGYIESSSLECFYYAEERVKVADTASHRPSTGAASSRAEATRAAVTVPVQPTGLAAGRYGMLARISKRGPRCLVEEIKRGGTELGAMKLRRWTVMDGGPRQSVWQSTSAA